jgi:hypothetical protein
VSTEVASYNRQCRGRNREGDKEEGRETQSGKQRRETDGRQRKETEIE